MHCAFTQDKIPERGMKHDQVGISDVGSLSLEEGQGAPDRGSPQSFMHCELTIYDIIPGFCPKILGSLQWSVSADSGPCLSRVVGLESIEGMIMSSEYWVPE